MPTAFLAPRLQGHESVACHPATLAARRGAARIRPRPHPMKLLWGNLKATELANLCPDTLDEADTAAHTGLHRIGSSYQLCFNFLAQVSTVRKSQASAAAAWARRNWVQLGPPRRGAGPRRWRRRMVRTDVAETFTPSLRHSPEMRTYPQRRCRGPAAAPARLPPDPAVAGCRWLGTSTAGGSARGATEAASTG